MMDKDSLHGDTGLTGIPEPADCAALCGKLQIGIGLHDHARVPAKFQHHLLLPALGLQHPSHGGAARKAQEFEARIDDKLFCYPVVAGHDVECARRKSGFQNYFAQE